MIATAPRLQVCLEYQHLLQQCQQTLADLQHLRTIAGRSPLAAAQVEKQLQRLQSSYNRAYALLENHQQSCSHCQYISKIAGLDFESMSEALIQYRRPG